MSRKVLEMTKDNKLVTNPIMRVLGGNLLTFAESIYALASDNPEEGEDSKSLKEKLKRSEAKADLALVRTRIQQEMAIASRIASATEVEIEEYYEGSGKGTAGLKADAEAVTLGLSGEGKKITKRIVRCKGWQNDSTLEVDRSVSLVSKDSKS